MEGLRVREIILCINAGNEFRSWQNSSFRVTVEQARSLRKAYEEQLCKVAAVMIPDGSCMFSRDGK